MVPLKVGQHKPVCTALKWHQTEIYPFNPHIFAGDWYVTDIIITRENKSSLTFFAAASLPIFSTPLYHLLRRQIFGFTF
jgi:hypothetical protein